MSLATDYSPHKRVVVVVDLYQVGRQCVLLQDLLLEESLTDHTRQQLMFRVADQRTYIIELLWQRDGRVVDMRWPS